MGGLGFQIVGHSQDKNALYPPQMFYKLQGQSITKRIYKKLLDASITHYQFVRPLGNHTNTKYIPSMILLWGA
jgi:hypothetical protein